MNLKDVLKFILLLVLIQIISFPQILADCYDNIPEAERLHIKSKIDDCEKAIIKSVDKLPPQVKNIVSNFEDEATKAKFISDYFDEGAGAFRKAVDDRLELVKGWKVLDEAGSPLKTNINELGKVADNIDDVKDLGYNLWKQIDELEFSDAFTHLKTRKSGPRKKGIVGCHDKTVFFDQNVIRSVDATGNLSYAPQIGKTTDQVEEIVITSRIPHSKVPGVEVVEYKIPTLSNTNPPLTTGQLSKPSNGGVKTLYDPNVWTESKLKKAINEATMYYAKKNGSLIEGEALVGKTVEGYEIEFFYKNGIIETFYFK